MLVSRSILAQRRKQAQTQYDQCFQNMFSRAIFEEEGLNPEPGKAKPIVYVEDDDEDDAPYAYVCGKRVRIREDELNIPNFIVPK